MNYKDAELKLKLKIEPESELLHNSLKDTLISCYDRLQATYMCNHEVMDADDLSELLTTMKDVQYYITTED